MSEPAGKNERTESDLVGNIVKSSTEKTKSKKAKKNKKAKELPKLESGENGVAKKAGVDSNTPSKLAVKSKIGKKKDKKRIENGSVENKVDAEPLKKSRVILGQFCNVGSIELAKRLPVIMPAQYDATKTSESLSLKQVCTK